MAQGAGGAFGGSLIVDNPSNGTAYTKGDFYIKGGVVGICLDDIPAGEKGAVQLYGVFKIAKVVGDAITPGGKIYANDNEPLITNASRGRYTSHVGYSLNTLPSSGSGDVELLLAFGSV